MKWLKRKRKYNHYDMLWMMYIANRGMREKK